MRQVGRLADQAVNIAEAARDILARTPLTQSEIQRMAEVAIRMAEDSIQAFIEEDVGLARKVRESGNTVDELADLIREQLVETMVAAAPIAHLSAYTVGFCFSRRLEPATSGL